MKKISRIVAVLLTVAIGSVGCDINNINPNKENVTDGNVQAVDISLSAEEAKVTEVITVGQNKVYLDEVRYYAYNTQATYEAYYMAEEKQLDWSSEIEEGIALEEAVKSTLLDTICEREAIVAYAGEYDVTLTEEELTEVSDKVDKFYTDTNKKLLERTDVEQERLKEIFEKDKLYKKVKNAMENTESGKSEEAYKNWKKANNVITNSYWDAINFQTPILVE